MQFGGDRRRCAGHLRRHSARGVDSVRHGLDSYVPRCVSPRSLYVYGSGVATLLFLFLFKTFGLYVRPKPAPLAILFRVSSAHGLGHPARDGAGVRDSHRTALLSNGGWNFVLHADGLLTLSVASCSGSNCTSRSIAAVNRVIILGVNPVAAA